MEAHGVNGLSLLRQPCKMLPHLLETKDISTGTTLNILQFLHVICWSWGVRVSCGPGDTLALLPYIVCKSYDSNLS